MDGRKKTYPGSPPRQYTGVLEASLYNLYWVWSVVALIIFGNLAEAQRTMQDTARHITGQERLARKVIMKIFTDLAVEPEHNLELLLRSTFIYELQQPGKDFSLTKKLILCLRRQHLLPPEECTRWEKRLSDINVNV